MYLSKYGFVIRKNEISEDELLRIKNELIATPIVNKQFNNVDNSYKVYIETDNKIYIPKRYGIEKYGNVKELENYIGKKIETLEFKGYLKEEQKEIFEIMMKSLYENGGGILQASAGIGKSVLALKIITELKVKTLIIVEKVSLMNQWIDEIKKFIPEAKIGIIQGQKCETEDCDIILGMIQSLSMKNYSLDKFKEIGFIVIDEIHHSSAKIFSKVLFKVASKYSIGLSATPNRSDGLEYVFKWHFGDVVCKKVGEKKGKPPIIRLIKLNSKDYKEIKRMDYTGKEIIQYTSMISHLVEMKNRNIFIIKTIQNLILEKRCILVLSDRRNHLNILNDMLKELNVDFTYGLFLGGMKKLELENTKECNVILATFQSFSEGISVKNLDTLIMITPKKFIGHLKTKNKNENFNIEQIVGRIFRKEHVDINPLIIDLQDNFSIYKSQSAGRKVFYKQHFINGIFEEEKINV